MNKLKCKNCGAILSYDELVQWIDDIGEVWDVCSECYSDNLEWVEISQSPHSLKTYYELEEDL